MTKIGLTMIAKDEAKLITRALNSVKPLVDHVLVCDTGSTDDTQQIVSEWLSTNDVSGIIVEEPWLDFAYNRSFALAALRNIEAIDYALILDADDVIEIRGDPSIIKCKLSSDVYAIPVRHGSLVHRRAHLCSNHKPFRFRGVVHEFLHCDQPFRQDHLDDLSIRVIGGGVRGRNGHNVYLRDAELLSKALASGKDEDLRPRYMFYLAQSWRDAGEKQKALSTYLQRASMSGWNQEVYVSLLHAGRLMAQLERPLYEALDTWKKAITLIPARAEAYHGAAVACRNAGCLHEALAFARRGIGRPQPEGLFIEPWVYQYGLLDEYSIAAYWTGLPAESLLASLIILDNKDIDATTRARIQKNAEFAKTGCLNAK